MHLHRFGQRGPVCLLLHGAPSSARHLFPLAEQLAADHRVLAPDLPGYGRTPRLSPYSWETVVDELRALLASEAPDGAHLIGHSGGAYLACGIAASGHPARSITLLGGFAGLDAPVRDAYRQFDRLLRDPSFDAAPLWVQRCFPKSFADRHPDAVAEVTSWLQDIPAEALADQLGALANAADYRPLLRGVRAPVLALVGSLDEATPPAWSQELAGLAPDARVERLDGLGHTLLLEAPGEVLPKVGAFIRAHESR